MEIQMNTETRHTNGTATAHPPVTPPATAEPEPTTPSAEFRNAPKPSHAARTNRTDEKATGHKIERVKLTDINRPDDLRMRAAFNQEAIADYADRYSRQRAGKLEPGERPMDLMHLYRVANVVGLLLVDGWHRYEAMERSGYDSCDAILHEGSYEDASQFAAKANRAHIGVRVTNADKQRICENLCKRCIRLSSRAIGKLAGVDGKTVEKYRKKDASGSNNTRIDKNNVKRRMPNPKTKKSGAANAASSHSATTPQPIGVNGTMPKPKEEPPTPVTFVHVEATNTVTPTTTSDFEQPPSTSVKPPMETPAVTESEEPETVPTQTITSRSGSVSLAVVSARGRTTIVVAAMDTTGADTLMALITRAQSLGLDLTKPKGGSVLRLLGLGLDEHEREMMGQKRLVQVAEDLAEAEAAAARSGSESAGTQQ
jgi:hypothetical protein